jgi:hypothetical protein
MARRLKPRYWRRIRDRRPFTAPYEQEPMPADLRAEVAARLSDDVAAFRELTGRPFADWSI